MPYKNKEKNKEAFMRWYKNNKQTQIRRVQEQREKLIKEVQDFKNKNPCTDCGLYYPHYVMDFDHVLDNKVANVSSLMRRGSKKQLWEEINKCELVCSNCHRERTYQRTI